MSLTIKAFLQRDSRSEPEIRRFQIPTDVSTSFDYLSKKLCDIFPALRPGKFSTFWKGRTTVYDQNFYFLQKKNFILFQSENICRLLIECGNGQRAIAMALCQSFVCACVRKLCFQKTSL